MDILRFGLDVKCCACTNVTLMPQLQCHFHYTAGTTWKWRWRLTSRQPRCCSSGSLSSCCRTWTLFPKRSTSTWSSTIMTRVRQVFDTPFRKKTKKTTTTQLIFSLFAHISKSHLKTTNLLGSRRVIVTGCGLREQLCILELVRCQQTFTAWNFRFLLSKAGWSQLRRGASSKQIQFCREITQVSRWVHRDIATLLSFLQLLKY